MEEEEIPLVSEPELLKEIPKLIHFIWAGGERRLGEENIATILSWSRKNPLWHIFVKPPFIPVLLNREIWV